MRPTMTDFRARLPSERKSFPVWLVVTLILGVGVLTAWVVVGGTYNDLVRLDQRVQSQWGQVENSYQRRADLVPNLVETVKGAAQFEQDTFREVAEARATVSQLGPATVEKAFKDPQALEHFQRAQEGLSTALSRLLVTVERYPELKATGAFRDLQAQLEGTENRITVERMRFNDAAREFNTRRNSFPTLVVAGLFGARFTDKPYFKALPGSETAPKVRF